MIINTSLEKNIKQLKRTSHLASLFLSREQVLSLKGQVKELEIKIDKLSQEFNKKSKNDGSEKYDKNSKY